MVGPAKFVQQHFEDVTDPRVDRGVNHDLLEMIFVALTGCVLSGVRSVAFSPDSTQLVNGGSGGTVRVYDVASGEERLTLRGHSDVVSVAFSPDGTRLVSGGDDVKVWDAENGQETYTFQGRCGPVSSVAFSPDGTPCGNSMYCRNQSSLALPKRSTSAQPFAPQMAAVNATKIISSRS